MSKDNYLGFLAEDELKDAIDEERGREPRSSFLRRMVIKGINLINKGRKLKE